MGRNRRETSTSKYWCAVPGCSSDARKDVKKCPLMKDVFFLPFPTKQKNPRLRAKWLELIRRTAEYKPKPYHRVCSRHFTAGQSFPELFPWNNYGKSSSTSTRDATSILKRESQLAQAQIQKDICICNMVVASDDDVDDDVDDVYYDAVDFSSSTLDIATNVPWPIRFDDVKTSTIITESNEVDDMDVDHGYSLNSLMKRPSFGVNPDAVECGTQTALTGLDIENLENKVIEYEQKFNDKNTLMRETFVDKILSSDKSVSNLTGLPNLDVFNTIDNITTNFDSKLKYWTRNKSADPKSYQNSSHKKPGPNRKLNRREELLLTLVRLRLAIPLSMLSILFGVSHSTISSIFTTWIFYLYHIFHTEIIWPSKELIVKHMPNSFKRLYPRTRAIIDCTEIFIQRPRNPSIQAKTYSSYKSHNTFKFLVSITPTGAFSFVSELWGGNCSDRYITMNSGFLDRISIGDEIMADRGFTIADLLLSKHAYFTIPPFTRKCNWGKGRRLNAYEIRKTRQIANLRIHVERAIQRLKSFRLISQTLPWSLKPVAYKMIVVASFFCNLMKPLVKKN